MKWKKIEYFDSECAGSKYLSRCILDLLIVPIHDNIISIELFINSKQKFIPGHAFQMNDQIQLISFISQ